jgi:hypothetical protein
VYTSFDAVVAELSVRVGFIVTGAGFIVCVIDSLLVPLLASVQVFVPE